LVNLVEDWEIVKDYAGDKQGFYQILGNDDAVEIRVAVGRVGFKKEFETKEDSLLKSIVAFCKSQKYIRVSESIRDDFFFK